MESYMRAGTSIPDWDAKALPICRGVNSLNLLGGAACFRYSSVRIYFSWGLSLGLRVLPASPMVIRGFCAARLLGSGVDVTTLQHDLETISVLHIEIKEAVAATFHNAARSDALRHSLKSWERTLKHITLASEPVPFFCFVTWVRTLSMKDAVQAHKRVCLQLQFFAAARQGALNGWKVLRKSRTSLEFLPTSNLNVFPHAVYGKVLHIRTDPGLDKGLTQYRHVYVPDKMKCGLTPVTDLESYLVNFMVPDGLIAAAPYSRLGASFRTTPYTGWSRFCATHHAKCFPQAAAVRVSSHSVRKSMVQALMDWIRIFGATAGFGSAEVGEFVGWKAVKQWVLLHYANLSMDQLCKMLHDLDPKVLPWKIVKAG